MANRMKGYGYSREVASKLDAKYDDEDERKIVEWINSITGDNYDGVGREAFHEWLKDGQVLCKLMNNIKPGSCKVNLPQPGKLPALRKNMEMENIGNFLKAAESFGLSRMDLFQTVDLYENTNMSQVQVTLFKLGGQLKSEGYEESIGVKNAEKNVRELDEQKMREGRNVIGLQMGTNQVASQKGMTPYGLGRQMTSK